MNREKTEERTARKDASNPSPPFFLSLSRLVAAKIAAALLFFTPLCVCVCVCVCVCECGIGISKTDGDTHTHTHTSILSYQQSATTDVCLE